MICVKPEKLDRTMFSAAMPYHIHLIPSPYYGHTISYICIYILHSYIN